MEIRRDSTEILRILAEILRLRVEILGVSVGEVVACERERQLQHARLLGVLLSCDVLRLVYGMCETCDDLLSHQHA